MNFEIIRQPQSAPGDFYVDSNCCTSCGVPQVVAPDLVGWIDEQMSQCYWKKQPETEQELEQAFAVFDAQELGCHRYAGSDPKIQARIGTENCDHVINPLSSASGEANPDPPSFSTESGFFERIWARIFGRSRKFLRSK